MTRALRAFAAGALLWIFAAIPASAQTSPNFTYGQVPTVAQWNALFAGKQDTLAGQPLLVTGGTMTGPLRTAASTSLFAGFNVPPGTAPGSPANGDLWTTTGGLFAQINGSTVGPFATSTGSVAGTNVVSSAQFGLWTFGDSVTAGLGSTSPSTLGYSALMANDFANSVGPYTDFGVSGYAAADANAQLWSNVNPKDSQNPIITLMIGTIDTSSFATPGYSTTYAQLQLASAARASLSATNTIAGTVATTTGTWANDTTYANLTGIKSSTSGSTATQSVVATNGLIYLYYGDYVSSGGTFTVTIDGVLATDAVTGNTTLTSQPAVAYVTTTPVTSAVALARYVVTPGTHTVLIAVTSSTGAGNPVSIFGFAAPPAIKNRGTTAPKIFLGGVIYENNDANGTLSAAVNAAAQSAANTLSGDGLNVVFVDVRKYANATLDMTGTPTQNCPASVFPGLHPNDCGHRHLAQAFEDAINPINMAVGANLAVASLKFTNATSGSITVTPPAGALGTVTQTLQDVTDTFVYRATTDTLTNKTYDTGGTGNVFKIAGTTISSISGNAAELASATGAFTSGNCVKSDASHNLIDAGTTCGGGGGSGTVTSVGFTGGLISVANPTTTPALTVAGTSGGIPYFSGASTWASSAALAANAIVIGGGAGVAPATTTTGTGVVTALGVNVGSAGAFVTFNGAGGTPSSMTATNLSGTAASLTAGAATNAVNTGITEDTTTNAAMNLTWVTSNTGNLPQKTTSTKLTFNPSTGVLSSTSFTGAGTGLTGTAASLTAGTASAVAVGGITGLGTGVATALGNATNGTGGPVTFNGNIGTTATGHASLDLALTGGTMSGAIAMGGNNITGGGTGAFTTLTSAAHTITSASANALAVGLNGATNPAFNVDSSTALQVAGISVKGAVTGGTVSITATDSGANTALTINAKGTGNLALGTLTTGSIDIGNSTGNTVIHGGAITFSNNATFYLSAAQWLRPDIGGFWAAAFSSNDSLLRWNDASGNANAITFGTLGQITIQSSYVSAGTKPTGTTGTCTASSFAGGAVAGTFSAAVCTATNTFILSAMPTAPTGYTCDATDRTTSTSKLRQTATSTTSATFTVDVATVASDVVEFKCMAY